MEWRYSSTLSLNWTKGGEGCPKPRSGRFTDGKETRYPLYRSTVGWVGLGTGLDG